MSDPPAYERRGQRKLSDLESEMTRIKERNEGVPMLDLNFFKTQPCKLSKSHNPKRCVYYHGQDRRRPLGTYTSELCEEGDKACRAQLNCEKAHNRVEELYHPEKYKSKYCKAFYECRSGKNPTMKISKKRGKSKRNFYQSLTDI